MTAELSEEILLSSGNGADVETLISWMEEVLNPRRDSAFHVSTWLFHRWLQGYRQLVDEGRQFNIIQDGVLVLDQQAIDKRLNSPLPPTVPAGTDYVVLPQTKLSTIFCPNVVPTNIYGSSGRRFYLPRISPQDDVIHEIVKSYIASRIQPSEKYPTIKPEFLEQTGPETYTDFSQRPLGEAMTEYGKTISETATYKDILKAMRRKYRHSDRLFKHFVAKHIMTSNQPIIYDRIMTVCLLGSDLVNDELSEGNVALARMIYLTTGHCFRQTTEMTNVVQQGFFRLAHYYTEIKKKTEFDLLYDHTLIGGQPPTASATPAPQQKLPIISKIIGEPGRKGKMVAASTVVAATAGSSSSSSQSKVVVVTTGEWSTKVPVTVSTSGNTTTAVTTTSTSDSGPKTAAAVGTNPATAQMQGAGLLSEIEDMTEEQLLDFIGGDPEEDDDYWDTIGGRTAQTNPAIQDAATTSGATAVIQGVSTATGAPASQQSTDQPADILAGAVKYVFGEGGLKNSDNTDGGGQG